MKELGGRTVLRRIDRWPGRPDRENIYGIIIHETFAQNIVENIYNMVIYYYKKKYLYLNRHI